MLVFILPQNGLKAARIIYLLTTPKDSWSLICPALPQEFSPSPIPDEKAYSSEGHPPSLLVTMGVNLGPDPSYHPIITRSQRVNRGIIIILLNCFTLILVQI